MKLSELIEQLQGFEKEYGADIEVKRPEWDMHNMDIYYVDIEQAVIDEQDEQQFIAIE